MREFFEVRDQAGRRFGLYYIPLDYMEYWSEWTEYTRRDLDEWSKIDEAEEEEFENMLMQIESGQWLALLDAIYFCQGLRLPLPEHLLTKISEFFAAALSGSSLGKKGRGNSPLAKARNAAIRERRYWLVAGIRSAQRYFSNHPLPKAEDGTLGDEGFDLIGRLFLPPDVENLYWSGEIKSFGSTVDDAISIAAKCLRGTNASLSEDHLKDEFYKYDERTYRYDEQTLKAIGIETAPERSSFDVPLEEEGNWRPHPEPWERHRVK